MKKKRSDLITEGIREKIQHDSWDHNEEFKLKRSKWIRWLLNIIDNIVTALT
jgi:metal-responsive CopG/Arc/MetJ family transcriptional regulator